MNRLSEILTDHDHGEEVNDKFHYPEYTKGCWGQPNRSKCWLCKVRFPVKLIKLSKRIRDRN